MTIKNITEEVTALRKLHLRVEQLENINKDFDYQRPIENHAERLEKLEGYMEMEDRVTVCSVMNRLFLLEEKLDNLDGRLNAEGYFVGKAPHKCPVCEGSSYTSHVREDGVKRLGPCKVCEGKGIVWG